jgi:hypothetical protein
MISGVIYPLRRNNYLLLKNRCNPIFIKYLTHTYSKRPIKIVKGNILFLYLSCENKSIVGYSKIIDVFFKKPLEIKNNFINNIQMKKNEFEKYIIGRDNKPLLCLKLDKIIEFHNEVNSEYKITMTGKYLNQNDINNLLDI